MVFIVDFGTDGVLLALESGFYEFIPETDWGLTHPSTLLPHEVEVGQKYRIVVTNYNGFYRYDVGDVVEIEGFQGRTPIFIFRNRFNGFISAIGEKTTEYHVSLAMSLLQQQCDVSLTNFCMTLTDEIPPAYVLNVELPPGASLSNPGAFIGRFDQLLSEGHHLYGVKRVNQLLPAPILRILKPGSFERLQQQMILGGVSATQIKLPKISNDRKLFDVSMVLEELHFNNSGE
ncbi:MAG: GH3 auxin-responsive promoter family protein [Acaryochloridaceae cyanobacterium RL_2_7]|nr:GH3 auxin-responsive promoter family protein [Acaryochloridaceae cyanobacterium RL_2_7]